MKKLIIAVVVLVVAGAIIFAAFGSGGEEGFAVTAQAADRGNITSVVTATGKTYPETEVRISSEVAGEIIELPVVDGQQIEKGDLLVRVNPDTLEAQVKQQEAALRASMAAAAEARAQLDQATIDLRRMENLYERGYATQEQVDAARTAHEVRVASLNAAQARIEQQEMALKEANDLLSKASIFSPIAGTITVLASELGDRVVGTGQFEGTEIMRVANLENMEVRVEVSEADIVGVKLGDEASIELDAIPDQVFDGVVTQIANSAANESGTSQGGSQDELTTFEVRIRLNEPSEEIRPGMTATADIRTQTVEGVVRVPLQAVTVRPRDEVRKQLGEEAAKPEAEGEEAGKRGGRGGRAARDNLQRVVFVVRDGRAYLTPVETGIADMRFIEIKSGLEEGNMVVTGGYRILSRELTHEAQVRIEEPTGGFGGPGGPNDGPGGR